jgi:hypothetical protein
VEGKVTAFDEKKGTGVFDATIRADRLVVTGTRKGQGCPFAEAKSLDMTSHAELGSEVPQSGSLHVNARGASLRWGDFRVAGDAEIHSKLAPKKPGATSQVVSTTVKVGDVRLRSGGGPPERWSAEVPELRVEADLVLDGEELKGPVAVTASRTRAAIGKVGMTADVTARFRMDPASLLTRGAIVTGDVDVRKASLRSGGRHVENWWASIVLEPTQIAVRDNLDLTGRATAKFRDGMPALLALAQADEVPGWLPAVLPLNDLTATLDVERHCRLTEIILPKVEGGPLVAEGHLQNVPGDTSGAVLIRLSGLGFVSVGVSLGAEGDGVSPLVGDDWLEAHVAPLGRRARTVWAQRCEPDPEPSCSN